MWTFLARRVLWMVPTFLGITLIGFAILNLAPGDPLALSGDVASAGQGSREAIEAFRREMALDQPVHVRYLRWLSRVATFDFGVSSYDQRPVVDKVAEALPTTLLLSGLALLLAWLLAIPTGVLAALKRGTLFDKSLSTGLLALYSLPSFWLAILLVTLLAGGWLDLFPARGLRSPGAEAMGPLSRLADLAWHLVLPVTSLAAASIAVASRYLRAAMIHELRQDYVRTARAKGLTELGVTGHALRNALIPVVTLVGLSFPGLVGGSVVVEQIFGLPGMGRLGFLAVATRDYNTVMAVTTLAALVTMAGLLLSDLAYSLIDPRIRRS